MSFNFENLKIWQKSLELSGKISTIVKKFPQDELFVLTTQIKKAADSVNLNIAEGSIGQQSKAEYRRFLGYSTRSAIEVISCLHLAKARNLISKPAFEAIYEEYEDLIVTIEALRKTL